MAQAGHGGGDIQRTLGRTARVVRNGSNQRVEFGGVEIADVRRLAGALRLVDELARIRCRVTATYGELEDRVQQTEVVENALGGSACRGASPR